MLNIKAIDPETYYSVKEVTKFLDMKPNTIYLWISQGKIKNVKKMGTRTYVKGQDILDLIEEK